MIISTGPVFSIHLDQFSNALRLNLRPCCSAVLTLSRLKRRFGLEGTCLEPANVTEIIRCLQHEATAGGTFTTIFFILVEAVDIHSLGSIAINRSFSTQARFSHPPRKFSYFRYNILPKRTTYLKPKAQATGRLPRTELIILSEAGVKSLISQADWYTPCYKGKL